MRKNKLINSKFRVVWSGIILCTSLLYSQSSPKHEFRAVWVCTLANLDWPSKRGLTAQQQQQEFIRLADEIKAHGMNALVMQVRPAGDAFYPSKLAPWSEYLSGTQGKAPSPYYDPLAFMIKTCHERNIEFHAWVNPFRAISHRKFSQVSDGHIAKKHPEWLLDYGVTTYLNPGIPKARAYVIKVISEIVRNYPVDGIHMDDYFYPYPLPGQPLPDRVTYLKYGSKFSSIAAWRRDNINRFIQQLSDSIHHIAPKLKFGISPPGVWRHQHQDPRGSETQYSPSSYDELFADSKKWADSCWVDYLCPQLYWHSRHPKSSYLVLLKWWEKQTFRPHLYIGHHFMLMKNAHTGKSELPIQLTATYKSSKAKGNIYFRLKSFRENIQGWKDTLRLRYSTEALTPPMPWLDSIPPEKPTKLFAIPQPNGIFITWEASLPASDGDTAVRYLLYRFTPEEFNGKLNMKNVIQNSSKRYYLDTKAFNNKKYLYIVTALDRMQNESQPLKVSISPTN